jgi:hypothetical protein
LAFADDGSPIELLDRWWISGANDLQANLLNLLAQRAGLGLGFLEKMNAAYFWFDYLRKKRLYYCADEFCVDLEGKKIVVGGTITNLWLSSTQALEELITEACLHEFTANGPGPRINCTEARSISAEIGLQAIIDAINDEFKSSVKSGQDRVPARNRALLQTVDVLFENLILRDELESEDLLGEVLPANIVDRTLATAAELVGFPNAEGLLNEERRIASGRFSYGEQSSLRE